MISRIILIAVVAIYICIDCVLKRKRVTTGKYIFQLSIPMFLITAFFTSALLSPYTIKSECLSIILEGGALLLADLYIVISGLWVVYSYRSEYGQRCKYFMKNHMLNLAIIILFIVATRSWMNAWILLADSSEYAAELSRACLNFDFSFKCLKYFGLCTHPCYTISLLAAPVVFLNPNITDHLQEIQLFYAAISGVFLYLFLDGFNHKRSHLCPLFGTLLFFVNPLIWGMHGGFTPDYFAVLLLPMLLWSDARGYSVLTFLFALLVVLTKEASFIYIGGYSVAKGFYYLLRWENTGSFFRRLFQAVTHKKVYPLTIGCVLATLYFVYLKFFGLLWTPAGGSKNVTAGLWPNTIWNSFGLSTDNILTRVKETFFLNFTWVVVLLAILLAACLIFRKKSVVKNGASNSKRDTCEVNPYDLICSLLGGLFAQLTFLCIYINAGLPRYVSLMQGSLLIVVLIGFIAFVRLALPCILSLIVTGCLFGWQSFSPADPVSNYLFNRYDVGASEILCVSQRSFPRPTDFDYYMYNLQYLWEGKATQEVFARSQYSPRDAIFVMGNTYEECWMNGAVVDIQGRYSYGVRIKGWNEDRQRYETIVGQSKNSLNTVYINSLMGYGSSLSALVGDDYCYNKILDSLSNQYNYSRYIVYFDPIVGVNEQQALEFLEQWFIIGMKNTVNVHDYCINYYIMTKRPSYTYDIGIDLFSVPSYSVWSDSIIRTSNDVPSGITIYDPDSFVSQTPVSEEFVRSEIVQSTIQYSGTEIDRTVLQEGDLVTCKIRMMDGDRWIRNSLYPNGVITEDFYVGTSYYVADIGMSLIGAELGQMIRWTADIPEEYAHIRPMLAGRTITFEIFPITIKSGLYDNIEDTISYYMQTSYEDLFNQVEESLVKLPVKPTSIVTFCQEKSTYEPEAYQIEQHKTDFLEYLEPYAKELDLPVRAYIHFYLGMSDEQIEEASYRFARSELIQSEIIDAYVASGIDINSY